MGIVADEQSAVLFANAAYPAYVRNPAEVVGRCDVHRVNSAARQRFLHRFGRSAALAKPRRAALGEYPLYVYIQQHAGAYERAVAVSRGGYGHTPAEMPRGYAQRRFYAKAAALRRPAGSTRAEYLRRAPLALRYHALALKKRVRALYLGEVKRFKTMYLTPLVPRHMQPRNARSGVIFCEFIQAHAYPSFCARISPYLIRYTRTCIFTIYVFQLLSLRAASAVFISFAIPRRIVLLTVDGQTPCCCAIERTVSPSL